MKIVGPFNWFLDRDFIHWFGFDKTVQVFSVLVRFALVFALGADVK